MQNSTSGTEDKTEKGEQEEPNPWLRRPAYLLL
jgi:hypothetical protein